MPVNKGTALRRKLNEVALYPSHAPRRATALYVKSHHNLVVVQDLPCLSCGVRNSDLKDPKRRRDPAINRWGAKAMETHHRLVEDGLANAVDLAKFNERALPGLLRHYKDEAKYGHPFTQEEMLTWIHGDEANLWVLCSCCHRSPLIGIHSITGPIWSVQDLLFDDYDLTGFVAYTPEEAKALEALPNTKGVPKVQK